MYACARVGGLGGRAPSRPLRERMHADSEAKKGLSRGKSWKVESENPCISRFFGSFLMVSLENSWKIKIGCTMEVQETDGREVCGWERAVGR